MGSLICEAGEPVPVILDDALVFSDDDRIERTFDALIRAGQRQQVNRSHLPHAGFCKPWR
jgi:uncharacterized protein YhaN